MSVDREGGTIRHGRLTLVIPEGALDEPVAITVEEIDPPQRGAVVPAYELGPDGLEFKKAANIYISYEGIDLPPGIDASRLEISFLDSGHWVALADQENDPSEKQVVADLQHFSTYTLVPEPGVATGAGTHLELNGILVDAGASFYGRLFVSPYYVSLYAESAGDENVTVTFSGLPADEPNYAYVGTYGDERVLQPAEGGRMAFDLDLHEPAFIWFQPDHGTTFIGGGVDQCASVGVRIGDVCTLATDVTGSVELLSGTLDCDGHSIFQEADHIREGTGIFVGPNAVSPQILDCTIGGPGAYFGNGIQAVRTDGLVAAGNRPMDNDVGIVLQSSSDSSISTNEVSGRSYWAIALWDASCGNEVDMNSVAVAEDGITLEGVVGAANTNNILRDNTILGGTGGFLIGSAQGNEISGNDRDGGVTGLAIFAGGWPNRVYWNNFAGLSGFGVFVAPEFPLTPIEVSYDGKGNFWGHSCPGTLFTPGVDSSRPDVTDSFAYGLRDAWLVGAGPGCLPEDTTPPDPPVINIPAEGDVVFTSTPTIIGTAEAGSTITLVEAGAMLGTGMVSVEGQFGVPIAEPLAAGAHILQATATDAAGNVSALSSSRTFTVRDVSDANPLAGSAGRFRVVELADFPDAFEPGLGPNHLRAVARVDPVAGLGGASSNHRFLAALRRTIKDPATGSTVSTTLGFAEIPNVAGAGGEPVTAIIDDYWCGTDQAGIPVERGLVYPYDLSIQILRQYVGPGQGPRCSRGETPLTTGPGSPACLVDSLQAANLGAVNVVQAPGGTLPMRPYCYPDLLMLTDKARTMDIPDLVYPRIYFTRAISRVEGEDFMITPSETGCGLATVEGRAACILSRTSAFGIDDPETQLRHVRTDLTSLGENIVRFQQVLQAWDVLGSQVLVVEDGGGSITEVFSHFIPDLQIVNSRTGDYAADFAAFDEAAARRSIEEELAHLGEPIDPPPEIRFDADLVYVDHAGENPDGRLAVRAIVTPASGPGAGRAFIMDVSDAGVIESRLTYARYDVEIDTMYAYPAMSEQTCDPEPCAAPYDYCHPDFLDDSRCVNRCISQSECYDTLGIYWRCAFDLYEGICHCTSRDHAQKIYTDYYLAPEYVNFMPYRRIVEAVGATSDFFYDDLGRRGWNDPPLPAEPLSFHTYIHDELTGANFDEPWVDILYTKFFEDDEPLSSVERYWTAGHEWNHKMVQCITGGLGPDRDCGGNENLDDGHYCLGEGIAGLYGALIATKSFGGSDTRWPDDRYCDTGIEVNRSPWNDETFGLEICRNADPYAPYALRSRFDCGDCGRTDSITFREGSSCVVDADCLPYEACERNPDDFWYWECSSKPHPHNCDHVWNRFGRMLVEGGDTFANDGTGEDVGLSFNGHGYDRGVDIVYMATQQLIPSSTVFDWADSLKAAERSTSRFFFLPIFAPEAGPAPYSLGAIGFLSAPRPFFPLSFLEPYVSDKAPSSTRFNAWLMDTAKYFTAWRDPSTHMIKVRYFKGGRMQIDTIATTDYRPVLIEYNDVLHVFCVKDGHIYLTYYLASGHMSPSIYDLGERMNLISDGEIDAAIFQGSLYLVFTRGIYKQVQLARCIAPPGYACTGSEPIGSRWYDFSGTWYTTVLDATMFKGKIAAAAVSGIDGTASPGTEYLYVAGNCSAVANENQIRVAQIDSGHRMVHIESVPDRYPSYRTLGSIGLRASRSAFGDRNYLVLAWADSVSSEVYISVIRAWDDVDGSDTWFTRSTPMGEKVIGGVSWVREGALDEATAGFLMPIWPSGYLVQSSLYGRY